jgi:hypothetical protein
METRNLAELYELPPIDWAQIEAQLDEGAIDAPDAGGPDRPNTCWLATVDRDGRPHVTGIGAIWADGAFWFTTGEQTRKGRNVARDPRCTLSVATLQFDLVVEGEAQLVTDPAVVAERARQWADGGWPAGVDESGLALTAEYSAPSAGPPPWRVYHLVPTAATAVLVSAPGGATRWTFGDGSRNGG